MAKKSFPTPSSLCLLLSAILFSLQLIQIVKDPLNTVRDNAFLLQCGQMLVAGKIPYVDYIETNPPLVIYVFALPAAISTITKMHVITVFLICVWLLSLLSVAVTGTMLLARKQHECYPLFGPLILAAAVFNGQLGIEYGQKEHLFVLCFLPFFFCRWLRWNSELTAPYQSAAIGIFAGIGMCLKPQFLLIPLALELYWLASKRVIKPMLAAEVISCSFVALFYVLHFVFVPTAMQNKFFQHILPAMVNGYSIYGKPWMLLIANHLPVVLVLCLLAWLLRRRCSLCTPLSIWTVSGYLLYLIQSKGWSYQAIPLFFGCCALSALELAFVLRIMLRELGGPVPMMQRRLGETGAILALFAAAFICLFPSIDQSFYFWRTDRSSVSAVSKLVAEQSKKGDAVLILSTGLEPAYPTLTQLERQQGSRYGQFEIFPMLEHCKAAATDGFERMHWQNEQDLVMRELADDIHRIQPKLVIIEARSSYNHVLPQCLLYYFEQRKFIDKHLADYEPLGVFEGFAAWRLKPVNSPDQPQVHRKFGRMTVSQI